MTYKYLSQSGYDITYSEEKTEIDGKIAFYDDGSVIGDAPSGEKTEKYRELFENILPAVKYFRAYYAEGDNENGGESTLTDSMAEPYDGLYTAEKFLEMKYLPERCELIRGRIRLLAPCESALHGRIAEGLIHGMGKYLGENKVFSSPSRLILSGDTVMQPDIYVTGENGAPVFIGEIISPVSMVTDSLKKPVYYCEAGVKEYWVINPYKKRVLVYLWDGGRGEEELYSFEEDIPVSAIGGGELRLNISEYLKRQEE